MIGIIFASMTPSAFADEYIQNDQQYIGDDGAVHIVGEILNNLGIPLNQIHVKIDLFDENQQLIADFLSDHPEFSLTTSWQLWPGEWDGAGDGFYAALLRLD